MNSQRLETSRLFNRFGFGPRPGEYAQALTDGITQTRSKVLTVPAVDAGAADQDRGSRQPVHTVLP